MKELFYSNLLDVHGSLQTYNVSEDVRVGDGGKDITFTVRFDKMSCDFWFNILFA